MESCRHPASDSVLRTAVSALSLYDPDADDNSIESSEHKGIRLIAQIRPLSPIFFVSAQQEHFIPDPTVNLASNILYMFHGKMPNDTEIRAMDLLLMLHADHGLNASTFAARVTASTLSDIHSAVTSAIAH